MVHAQTSHRNGNGAAVHEKPARASELEIALPAMDALSEELNRLAAINAELVGRIRGAAAANADASPSADAEELNALRRENAELRSRVEELEHVLLASSSEDVWADRQREYEALLEEKSEVIRTLHLKLQEVQESMRRPMNGPIPKEEALVQFKEELEEQRRQLQQDEEAMMAQMRNMELALSKDRAELARQRSEVQRLQAELDRGVEHAGRDTGLRERLQSLRRPTEAPKKAADAGSNTPAPDAAADASKNNSGIFRRLFG